MKVCVFVLCSSLIFRLRVLFQLHARSDCTEWRSRGDSVTWRSVAFQSLTNIFTHRPCCQKYDLPWVERVYTILDALDICLALIYVYIARAWQKAFCHVEVRHSQECHMVVQLTQKCFWWYCAWLEWLLLHSSGRHCFPTHARALCQRRHGCRCCCSCWLKNESIQQVLPPPSTTPTTTSVWRPIKWSVTAASRRYFRHSWLVRSLGHWVESKLSCLRWEIMFTIKGTSSQI